MTRKRIHATALIGLLSALALVGGASAADKPRTLRGQLVHQIVMKWGNHIQEVYGTDVRVWTKQMAPYFAKSRVQTLRRAAEAHTFESMTGAFLPQASQTQTLGGKPAPSKLLGDSDIDLTYVPVSPCRIVDTRNAVGKIQGGTTRHYNLFPKANYTEYGGANEHCNIGNVSGASVAAIALNITVDQPESGGFLTAFPFSTPQPTASTLNYPIGQIRGNFAVLKVGTANGTGAELSMYSFATTHVVADVVGYFIRPERTALRCVDTVNNHELGAGQLVNLESPACPANYEITGGGCDSETPASTQFFSNRIVSSVNGDRQKCVLRNPTANPIAVTAYGRCCQTPGR